MSQSQSIFCSASQELMARLFGRFTLRCREQAVEELITGKAKELFCYLLIHRSHPIPREELAEVLWSECAKEHSLKYLRKVLWQLQRAVSPLSKNAEHLLHVDQHSIGLNTQASIWIDVAKFEQAFAGICESLQNGAPTIEQLRSAVELYQGDLLEGWYQDWCLCERERLQNVYFVILDRLMEQLDLQGDYEQGLQFGARVLQIDRAHEDTYRHLMRLRYMIGDRAGAIREYEHCRAALKEELGVVPSRQTRELYEQIRTDQRPANCESRTVAISSKVGLFISQPPPGDLRELRSALMRLEAAVQHTLRAVGMLLGRSPIPRRSSDKTAS